VVDPSALMHALDLHNERLGRGHRGRLVVLFKVIPVWSKDL
jgi:hypothetical protein